MQSSDVLNYALTILVGFIIIFGILMSVVMVNILKVLTKLAKEIGLVFVTMKTLKSGLQYSVLNVLSKGLNVFTSKRR